MREPDQVAVGRSSDERSAALAELYGEIHQRYSPFDPELVERRIVRGMADSEVFLLGQALGRDTQRLSGLPYCLPPSDRPKLSRGGKELDRFLACFGYTIDPLERGRKYAYHTDLAHYFPGRRQHGSGDLPPLSEEIQRSREWLERELAIVAPRAVVLLGREPAAVFLDRYAGVSVKRLDDVLARPIECHVADQVVPAIAVHHPSGAFQHPSSRAAYGKACGELIALLSQSR